MEEFKEWLKYFIMWIILLPIMVTIVLLPIIITYLTGHWLWLLLYLLIAPAILATASNA
jgi:hypothetical protein